MRYRTAKMVPRLNILLCVTILLMSCSGKNKKWRSAQDRKGQFIALHPHPDASRQQDYEQRSGFRSLQLTQRRLELENYWLKCDQYETAVDAFIEDSVGTKEELDELYQQARNALLEVDRLIRRTSFSIDEKERLYQRNREEYIRILSAHKRSKE